MAWCRRHPLFLCPAAFDCVLVNQGAHSPMAGATKKNEKNARCGFASKRLAFTSVHGLRTADDRGPDLKCAARGTPNRKVDVGAKTRHITDSLLLIVRRRPAGKFSMEKFLHEHSSAGTAMAGLVEFPGTRSCSAPTCRKSNRINCLHRFRIGKCASKNDQYSQRFTVIGWQAVSGRRIRKRSPSNPMSYARRPINSAVCGRICEWPDGGKWIR